MGRETAIQWTDATFNPVRGCSRISAGCDNCYAEAWSHRNPAVLGEWGPGGRRVFAPESYWKLPARWEREARERGAPMFVFCASLADLFEGDDGIGVRADYLPMLARLFDTIRATPNLRWLLLTKRPWNMAAYARLRDWPENAWAGCTVENQRAYDERVVHLRDVPAPVRFLSCEPLIGPVTFPHGLAGIGWVIAGGESGPHARPMHPDWPRYLRDECQRLSVPFHFKQHGEYEVASEANGHRDPKMATNGAVWVHEDGMVTSPSWHREDVSRAEAAKACAVMKVGKAKAGRLLDGVTWDGRPAAGSAS